MTPIVRAVFFDAVGTLIHPAEPPARTYAAAASRQGIALEETEVHRRMGAAFRAEEYRDRAAGWNTSEVREEERWRNIVAACLGDDRCFPELWDHYAKPEAWTVDADAGAVFDSLRRRGIALGLASNLDARLETVMFGHRVLQALRPKTCISSLVGHRKPSRRFFGSMIELVERPPGEIAHVGDDLGNDYEGARNAGMRAVLFDPNAKHPDIPNRIGSLRDLL